MALVLGAVLFQGFEIPDHIDGLGGHHKLMVHRLIGGDRVIDAMGPDDAEIRWAGRMQGGDAIGRARQIDQMRLSGAQTVFAWGGIARPVVVEEFSYVAERTYQVLYHICLTVVTNANGGSGGIVPSLDALVSSDMGLAGAAASFT